MQTGLECIGKIDLFSICEVITLAAKSLERFSENYVLDISHMGILGEILDDIDADAYAEPVSEVEFYLVLGEDVVTDWEKWDLSPLGTVAKVRFNFEYSEEMGGRYGFTIPGYFAYDDIAVRFDK